MTKDGQPMQENVIISTKYLCDLALYLSGLKDGKGNLLPLGTIVLDNLWNTIKYIQGDPRFSAERDIENGVLINTPPPNIDFKNVKEGN